MNAVASDTIPDTFPTITVMLGYSHSVKKNGIVEALNGMAAVFQFQVPHTKYEKKPKITDPITEPTGMGLAD